MRSVNKQMYKTTQVTSEVTAVSENIAMIREDKKYRIVTVVVEYNDVSGDAIHSESVSIANDLYDLLMQENPDYAPNKPQNEYRESDLWHIIDLIRSR